MALALKCPNPSCPFLFDPTQVPPGAVLTCPRCQMRFTLGTPGQSATPQNDFNPNLDFNAKPGTTTRPPATPSATTKTPDDAPADKPSFFQSRGMLIVGIAACAAVLFALAALFVINRDPPATRSANEKRFPDINLGMTVPEDWTADSDLKTAFKANVLAMQKPGSTARVVVASSNYNTRMPPTGELRDGLLSERLEAAFEDVEANPAEGTWFGRKAQKYTFRARGKESGVLVGEAYAVSHNGYAYWFLAWSSEADHANVKAELDAIRDSTRLLDPNAAWKATDSSSAIISGEAYTLTDGDKWWQKESDPTIEDAKADLLLTAKFKAKVRIDNPPKAIAVVYMLDGGDDPLGKLRTVVKERYAKLFNIKKWTDLTGPMQGDPPAAGEIAGVDAARYHAESSDDPRISKLVVLHTVALPGGKIAGIEVSCAWSDRGRWEKRLVHLAASLKSK